MNIYGDKIILRAIEKEDNAMLLRLLNDPDTEKMVTGSSFPASAEDQMRWFEGQRSDPTTLRGIIVDKSTDQAAGTIILSDIDRKNGTAQIHLKLEKESTGKGLGPEAVRLLSKYAFDEIRLNCLFAEVLTYNVRSAGMFEKCGYTKEGELRARAYKGGAYRNIYVYSLLRNEWNEQN